MSNDEVVRPDGWYLMNYTYLEGKKLSLEYLYNNGATRWDDYLDDEVEADQECIANDSVINLDHLKYLLENGGLEYAVNLVQKDIIAV